MKIKSQHIVLLFCLVLVQACDPILDGAAEGRAGTDLLLSGELEEAAEQFRLGLDASEGETGNTRRKLWHNLGLSLFGQEQFEEAADAFLQSSLLSVSTGDRAQAAYNAGTAYALASKPEEALPLLRQALILQPENEHARFNYELVKRQTQDSSENAEGTPPDPSAFAEEMKARADSLVVHRRYTDAFDLMNEALQQDTTVAAYNDFIQRLSGVAAIEASADTTQ